MVKTFPSMFKIVVNGVDVSSYLYNFNTQKPMNQPVKSGVLKLSRAVDAVLTVADALISKSVVITRGFATSTERCIFRGEITTWKMTGSIYQFDVADGMYGATKRQYDYTFNRNTDIEAGVASEIVKTLFTVAGISYNSTSVISTGTATTQTLLNYPAKGQIIDILKDLAKMYNYQLFFNDDLNLGYFIPQGYTSTSTRLVTGTDIINRIQWINTGQDISNSVTVIGGEQLDWTTETFAGPSSVVTLTAKPVDTEVSVAGVHKNRGVNSSDPKDFYVDTDAKKLYFTIPSSTIIVNYSYNVPVKVLVSNDASITLYTRRDSTITNSNLTNTDDAELQANNFITDNASALTSAPIVVAGNNNIDNGQEIEVVDNINNKDLFVIVSAIEYNMPYRPDKITVGKLPVNSLDIQLQVLNNIAKLQQQLSSDTSVNVQLINQEKSIAVSGYLSVAVASMDASVLYWDSNTQGTWDDFNWGNDTEETYTEAEKVYINGVVIT